MFEFGSGTVWMTPVGGNLPVNPTPIKVGTLQDISLDISFDLKMLYGQNQFPEAVARGKGKITGKAKFGRFNSDLINQMMFGQTRTVGSEAASLDEAATLTGTPVGALATAVIGGTPGTGFSVGDRLTPTLNGTGAILTVATLSGSAIATFTITAAGSAYTALTNTALTILTGAGSGAPTVTTTVSAGVAPGLVTVSGTATFLLDQGVIYASTGVPLLKLTVGAPAVGQYSVNLVGGYTFSTADSGVGVKISYLKSVAAAGVTQAISNQLMGFQPVVSITIRTSFLGQEAIIYLYSSVIGKLALASKQDDFTVPEIDFESFANSAGKVLDIYAAE